MTAYAQYSSQALFRYPFGEYKQKATQADNGGDVIQVADGRLGIVQTLGGGTDAIAVGDPETIRTTGVFDLACASGVTFAAGTKLYWDPVALTIVTTGGNANGSYYAGVAVQAKTSGQLWARVDINVPIVASGLTTLDGVATITATGTSVSTGAPLTGKLNFVSNGTASTGIAVTLPAPVAGLVVTVVNSWGTSINVFPNATTGVKLDNATNTAVAVAGYGTSVFRSDGTNWFSQTATA